MSNTFTVVVGEKGQITVPAELRKKYGITKGAVLLVEDNGKKLSFVPTIVIPRYDFDWDLEADLAEKDINNGNVKRYSVEEYLEQTNNRISLKEKEVIKESNLVKPINAGTTQRAENPKPRGKTK